MDDTANGSATVFRDREQPAISGQRWRPSSPGPEAVGLLTTCLALVRPVGFTDDNARDWLRVAAQEIAYLPLEVLREACGEARRTATHHAQIIPAIIKFADQRLGEVRRIDAFVEGFQQPALPKPDPWKPTQSELDELKAKVAESLSADR